jgi:putative ABC transport system permease protein
MATRATWRENGIGSALLVRSMANLAAVPHGFDPANLVTIRLNLPGARYPDTAAHARFYEQVLAEIRALPGVVAAAGTTGQPASPDTMTFSFAIEGRPSVNPSGREDPVPLQAVTPGYFETMRIPVLAGRVFTEADRGETTPVAVMNRALASRHWPNESPLGHRFAFRQEQPPFEIVGVVGDTYDAGLDRPAPPTIYVAFAQRHATWRWMSWQTLVIRTPPDAVVVPGVRRIVKRIDADLPLIEVSTVEAWYAAAAGVRRFAMQLVSVFAGLALLLAAIGIYGVLSCAIADRRQEIGIRLALGASSRALVATVTRASLVYAGVGAAAGLLIAALVTRFLTALLFNVPPTDSLTFAGAAAAVLVVAVLAAWLPARRALRVDPLSVLRS